MGKSRIYEIAKELNIDSKLIVEKLKEMNVDVKNHMSSITEEESMKIRQAFQKPATKQQFLLPAPAVLLQVFEKPV